MAHLRAGKPIDFSRARYTGSREQVEILRSTSLEGTLHDWIDGVRGANAEAYHYWVSALRVLPAGLK